MTPGQDLLLSNPGPTWDPITPTRDFNFSTWDPPGIPPGTPPGIPGGIPPKILHGKGCRIRNLTALKYRWTEKGNLKS